MNEKIKKNLNLILDEVDETYNIKILKDNLDKKEIFLYWGTTLQNSSSFISNTFVKN